MYASFTEALPHSGISVRSGVDLISPPLCVTDKLKLSNAKDLFKVIGLQEVERLGHNSSIDESRICWKESVQNSDVLDLNYRTLVSY